MHMNILIIFESYSSTTATVSDLLSEELRAGGHTVRVGRMSEGIRFWEESYDVVIFATPSWFDRGQEGQPHTAFLEFMDAHHADDFSGISCAFVGLGDANYAHFCLAVDILEDFFTKRGAKKPFETLKIDNFYMNEATEKEKLKAWCRAIGSR